MGSRRRATNNVDALLALPWQVLLVLTVVVYVGLKWIVPLLAAPNPILLPLAQALVGIAWLPTLIMAGISAGAFFMQRQSARQAPRLPRQAAVVLERTARLLDDPAPTDALQKDALGPEIKAIAAPKPVEWSSDVLWRMEWKRFESVVAAYYERKGFRAETIRCGADGGVDGTLFWGTLTEPIAILQCKAWGRRPVGVKPVRELLGVMADRNVKKGIFLVTGSYTDEARVFAANNPVMLISGQDFLNKIAELSADDQTALLDTATDGDWTTPSCPSCGTKMVERTSDRGKFWGCANCPRCRLTFVIR